MLRLQDVTYFVADYDEAIGFFVDGLGFEVRENETRPTKRRVVVGPCEGGTGLVLALAIPEVLESRAAGKVLCFLETDDFAAQHARMVAYGVRFREEPRHEAYGTVAVFEDPYGVPWDLIERPKNAG